jgi:hypothetical protein
MPYTRRERVDRLSNVSFHVIRGDGNNSVDNVVALFPDREKQIQQADSKHPHFQTILNGLTNGEDVYDLFDVQGGLVAQLTRLSDRVSFDGNNILFDGDVQTGPLADHLIRCLNSGVTDYEPVVRFWEKVATNPDKNSREQMFTWLRSHAFTITEDGDILGYKGVVGKSESEFRSSHSGTAYVDGVKIEGQIPNKIGTEVTMPRSMVANDPNVHCHYGLHVGDWSYASTFLSGGTILEVHVNPRDVVSIPNDSSCRKMRCCKYKVVKVRQAASTSPIERDEVDEWTMDVGYKAY